MCDCKTQIEAQLVDRFKAKHPGAREHKAQLQGYGFSLRGNTMLMLPFMPVAYGAAHDDKKTGRERWKQEKGSMTFRFCPFCGEKLLKEGA